MAWESKTGYFDDSEIQLIETMPVEELLATVLASDSLVALRVFTELALHTDEERYMALVADQNVQSHVAEYADDPDVSKLDFAFAFLFGELI